MILFPSVQFLCTMKGMIRKKEKTSFSAKETRQDFESLKALFLKKKKKLAASLVLNIVFIFAVMAIIGTKLFYPYHFIIGAGIYLLSWVWFFVYLWRARSLFKKFHSYEFAKSFYRKRKWRILWGIVFVIFLWSMHTVLPVFANPFAGMTSVEIKDQLQDDKQRSLLAMDQLDVGGAAVLDALAKNKSDEGLKAAWDDFALAVFLSENLTERYKYFHKLKGKEKTEAFVMTYSLYLRKQAYFHKILKASAGNKSAIKVLNDRVDVIEKSNIFSDMRSRFFDPQTVLRINMGRVYLFTSQESNQEWYRIFIHKAEDSYNYLVKNIDTTLYYIPKAMKEIFERNIFESWFPVQKNIANVMGNVRFSARHKGLITQPQIKEMQKEMQPGDIMVQRRNWYLSNIGIPGFWAHAALYTGTIEELDVFFSEIFPYEGSESFSEHLAAQYPNILDIYRNQKDTEGYDFSVIEAIEPGVVLTSIELSADADFVGVLRLNRDKKQILEGILKAYSHFGKPYDYNFDFDTNDSLVCSELVYKAYRNYINLPTGLLNGRRLMPPVRMVQKYDEERENENADLSFVYFLRGDESKGQAFVSDEEVFRGSWAWPKFSFQQQN